jgi:predicted GNAT family N-acyltransferase
MENLIGLAGIDWELKCPIGHEKREWHAWLEQTREMRGYVLYEEGLRPFFKKFDNNYYDCDPFDNRCYHILAKDNGKVIGCIRLLPMSQNLNCITSEAVGTEVIAKAMAGFGVAFNRLAEVSRWIVHPQYKKTLTGHYLALAVWGLANHLGYQFFASGGFKVNKLLSQYGGVYLSENAGPYYSEKYQDNVYILYFDKNKLSDKAISNIAKMQRVLKIAKLPLIVTA